jgi:hypothetical protein
VNRPLDGNPNLAEFIRIAAALGCVIAERKGTGELRFSHPAWTRTFLVNCRRKDTPREVLVAVRRLAMKEAA